jgi:hypothetical protein
MERKIRACMLCIGMHGGSQGWEIRKLFFVPQMLQELNAYQFTVSLYRGIEKMCFKQDTTILGSGDEVEMFMKFRTWIGGFVFHCHNLEHEDMRMMFNMDPRLLPTESPQQSQNLFP